jgi:hypothetical protein
VADQDDADDDSGQGQCVDGDAEGLPAVPAVEETLALDGAQERRELASDGSSGRVSRDGCGGLGHGGLRSLRERADLKKRTDQ